MQKLLAVSSFVASLLIGCGRASVEEPDSGTGTAEVATTPADSQNAKDYCDRGVRRKESGDYHGALADFSKAIELDPTMGAAYFGRGGVYFVMARQRDAIADYSKAIELDPNNADAHLFRGALYKELNMHDELIANNTKLIELAPDEATAYAHRGNAYYQLNQLEKASADMNKAIELSPKWEWARDLRDQIQEDLDRQE